MRSYFQYKLNYYENYNKLKVDTCAGLAYNVLAFKFLQEVQVRNEEVAVADTRFSEWCVTHLTYVEKIQCDILSNTL